MGRASTIVVLWEMTRDTRAGHPLQAQRARSEAEAASRSGGAGGRGATTQYVCSVSAVIVDNSETRIKDHLSGRNYK